LATQTVDEIISKKILQHLHIFFRIGQNENNTYKTTNKTTNKTKNNKIIHRKTLKHRKS
jgi:hypothetical protein